MGFMAGIILIKVFEKSKCTDTVKIIIFLSTAFLLVSTEDKLESIIPFSALIAVMCMGIVIKKCKPETSEKMAYGFNQMWTCAEILLFVLVGASVNIGYALNAGVSAVILILLMLIFRMTGVLLCLIKTKLTKNERLFCMLAYIPKATVQAAIGGIPLAMGLSCGNIVLTVAVLSIIITAPLGAFLIEFTYRKLLDK